MINIAVTLTALRKTLLAALIMAIGASTVELCQAFFSLKLAFMVSDMGAFRLWFQLAATVVFAILAVYFFFFSPETAAPRLKAGMSTTSDFFRGAAISLFNFMAYPYYVFYAVFLESNGWLSPSGSDLFFFCTGAFGGGVLALMVYAHLGSWLVSRFTDFSRYVNLFLAFLFLVLFLFQVYRMAIQLSF